jgi:hypothetical protein
MDDISAAFSDFAYDFVDAARSEDELDFCVMLATLAWNVSVQPAEVGEHLIAAFINKFRCPSFIHKGKKTDTREQVMNLAGRKARLYPGMNVIVRHLEFQDCKDGLHFTVTSTDPVVA